jgi:hypothetical protein
MSEQQLTPWFPVSIKPKRPGAYEARERNTRRVMPEVHWRKLDGTDYYDWYVCKGVFGPFLMWECVSHKITSWRGLAQGPERKKQPTEPRWPYDSKMQNVAKGGR